MNRNCEDIYYSYDVKDNCLYNLKMVDKIPFELYNDNRATFATDYDGITDGKEYYMSFDTIGKVE